MANSSPTPTPETAPPGADRAVRGQRVRHDRARRHGHDHGGQVGDGTGRPHDAGHARGRGARPRLEQGARDPGARAPRQVRPARHGRQRRGALWLEAAARGRRKARAMLWQRPRPSSGVSAGEPHHRAEPGGARGLGQEARLRRADRPGRAADHTRGGDAQAGQGLPASSARSAPASTPRTSSRARRATASTSASPACCSPRSSARRSSAASSRSTTPEAAMAVPGVVKVVGDAGRGPRRQRAQRRGRDREEHLGGDQGPREARGRVGR